MPDLDELRAFLAVVAAGSFQGAADELSVPRSTLRRRLESLEQRVGVPLLWTDTAGAHPTPAARLLLDDGAALLRSYRALLESALQAASSADRPPASADRLSGSDHDDGQDRRH